MPGEYDRYNMRRLVSFMANIEGEGEDLGRVSAKVRKAIADAGEMPRGVTVDVRGQIEPMNHSRASTFGSKSSRPQNTQLAGMSGSPPGL